MPIIVIIFVIIVTSSSFNQTREGVDESVFHVTLASPDLYANGVYSSTFTVNEGKYSFRFVPNGDSPQNLMISLKGESYDFSENFKLRGTPHQTGISEYYTWDYDGTKSITITNHQELSIHVNPDGNILGAVTIDIIKN